MHSPEFLLIVTAVFLLAGWIKGVVGMGLPTVAMGLLGLVMAPVQAAALLVIPSLVTNVWQFVAGPAKRIILRRLGVMMVFVCVGTAIGIHFLTSGSSRWPSIALGAVLAVYSLTALLLPRFSVPARLERALSPVVGVTTGVLAGATGVFAVPAVPYLSALPLSRDELVQALGLSFTVSTVALGVALGASGSYPTDILVASLGAVVPALAGMFIGQKTRNRIAPASFRRWFFIAMLLVGCYMVARALA
ncbi:MAG TPA: sulfite exporter TauE/SafE family protein [Burkholderiales bacterium]|nr:sulfite exporter TauE/SafE family protein [Burkholderiales bacterium]